MDIGFTTSANRSTKKISMYNEKIWSVTRRHHSKGVCAAVYAVVDQLIGKIQGLLT